MGHQVPATVVHNTIQGLLLQQFKALHPWSVGISLK